MNIILRKLASICSCWVKPIGLSGLGRLRTECVSIKDPCRNADDWQHNIDKSLFNFELSRFINITFTIISLQRLFYNIVLGFKFPSTGYSFNTYGLSEDSSVYITTICQIKYDVYFSFKISTNFSFSSDVYFSFKISTNFSFSSVSKIISVSISVSVNWRSIISVSISVSVNENITAVNRLHSLTWWQLSTP